MKFVIMVAQRDGYGNRIHARLNMRSYSEAGAKARADKIKGAFVCPLGSSVPVYVGAYQ